MDIQFVVIPKRFRSVASFFFSDKVMCNAHAYLPFVSHDTVA